MICGIFNYLDFHAPTIIFLLIKHCISSLLPWIHFSYFLVGGYQVRWRVALKKKELFVICWIAARKANGKWAWTVRMVKFWRTRKPRHWHKKLWWDRQTWEVETASETAPLKMTPQPTSLSILLICWAVVMIHWFKLLGKCLKFPAILAISLIFLSYFDGDLLSLFCPIWSLFVGAWILKFFAWKADDGGGVELISPSHPGPGSWELWPF